MNKEQTRKDWRDLPSSRFSRGHGGVWSGRRWTDFQRTHSKYDHIHFQGMGGGCRNKKPVSFHTLRHTYATLLHENGNSLHTIQNLMIHLHPGTTAQYICNSDALARKAADSLHLQPSRLKKLLSKVKELFR